MELYLIRHPAVACASGTCYGQTDVPLADGFEDQIEHLRRQLPDLAAFQVYSSPLSRCLTLAEALSFHQVHQNPDLMELNFGQWENRPWNDLPVDQVQAWSEDILHKAPPEGETTQMLIDRGTRFINRLFEQDQDTIVFTHTGWIRAVLSHLLQMPVDMAFRLHIDFCGVTRIKKKNKWLQIMYINRVN